MVGLTMPKMPPMWLWIVAAVMVFAGAQTVRLATAHLEVAHLKARISKSQADRATAYAKDSIKTAEKEQNHAADTQRAADAFTAGAPDRADALAADLQRADRLRHEADARAARYRAQAEAGAAACRSLADRAQALDGQLAEGLGVVGALRGDLARRDAEVVLLLDQIAADRRLMDADAWPAPGS